MRKTGLFAFILWAFAFIGICGLHRFYVGKPLTGLLWLLTFGLLGLGQVVDLFLLGSMVRKANVLNGLAGAGRSFSNGNVDSVAAVFNFSMHNSGGPIAGDPGSIQP
jgi:TM2 domain-containing membrane protein YozV